MSDPHHFRIDTLTREQLMSLTNPEPVPRISTQSNVPPMFMGMNSTDARYFDKDYGFTRNKIWCGTGWKEPEKKFMLPLSVRSHYPHTRSYPVHGTAGTLREAGGRSGPPIPNMKSKRAMVNEGEGKYTGGHVIVPKPYAPKEQHQHGMKALTLGGQVQRMRETYYEAERDAREQAVLEALSRRRVHPPMDARMPGEPQPYIYSPNNALYKAPPQIESDGYGRSVITPRQRPPGYIPASTGDPYFEPSPEYGTATQTGAF